MKTDHKLYPAEDSVVVFIDHQPQKTFGIANIDRATLIDNVTLLSTSRSGRPPHLARCGRHAGVIHPRRCSGTSLDIAILGGDPARFRPLVDLHWEAGRKQGWSNLKG